MKKKELDEILKKFNKQDLIKEEVLKKQIPYFDKINSRAILDSLLYNFREIDLEKGRNVI